MKKVRRALVVSMGAMTPAFIHPSTAQAAANPMPNEGAQSSTSTVALDQAALKNVLNALSPAEKLRIAGDRIRLSETTRQGGSPSPSLVLGDAAAHPRRCQIRPRDARFSRAQKGDLHKGPQWVLRVVAQRRSKGGGKHLPDANRAVRWARYARQTGIFPHCELGTLVL